jgi:hypothetical protein
VVQPLESDKLEVANAQQVGEPHKIKGMNEGLPMLGVTLGITEAEAAQPDVRRENGMHKDSTPLCTSRGIDYRREDRVEVKELDAPMEATTPTPQHDCHGNGSK